MSAAAAPWLELSAREWRWLLLGISGQALFSLRFIVQWLHSERAGHCVIPPSFWLLSLLGSVALLAYGAYRCDPIIVLGQLPGTAIYLRNLVLLRRPVNRDHPCASPSLH
jgi:lipid-A-disaccharide synthase-like uncharacterized protein